jgi:hypothetical protein
MKYRVDNNMQTGFDDDQNETKYFFPMLLKGLAGLRNLILLHKHLCFMQLQQNVLQLSVP